MKYNCGEHIQFLKYQQELKKQNKSLRTQDPIKYSKLLKYSARISEYLHWSQKDEYLQLIKDFLNSKIDGKEFDKKFSKMVTVIEKKSSLLFKNYSLGWLKGGPSPNCQRSSRALDVRTEPRAGQPPQLAFPKNADGAPGKRPGHPPQDAPREGREW